MRFTSTISAKRRLCYDKDKLKFESNNLISKKDNKLLFLLVNLLNGETGLRQSHVHNIYQSKRYV